MSPWYFVIVAILVGLFWLIRHRPKKRAVYPFKPRTGNTEIDLFLLLWSAHRNKNNLLSVKIDDHASKLAYDHAKKMALYQDVKHFAVWGNQREELAKMGAKNIMDIVDGNYYSIKTAFDGFVGSTSHNRKLLNKNADTGGVGIAQDLKGKYYVAVLIFER